MKENISYKKKKELEDNKYNNCILTICIIITLVTMIICGITYNSYCRKKQEVQDRYNRALYDFVSNINNIKNEMLKLKISSNDTYTLTTLSSIFAKANSAKADFELLPFTEDSMSNTSTFLTQLSDFSYCLMRNIINGKDINEYMDNVNTLYSKIEELSLVTEEIYIELNDGRIKWDELKKVGNAKMEELNACEESSHANLIGKTFTDYEGIIYDGAFSNHILTRTPSYLSNNELSINEVNIILKEKLNTLKVDFKQELDGRIPLYEYEVKIPECNVLKTVYVTKNDGKIYQMISDRECTEEKISIKEAREYAKSFILSLGIEDIEPTYYLKEDNMVTISYASVQDGVIIYSDLIKVKVALDTGEIMTFEANGYIFNHKEREINVKYSEEEAKNKLSEDVNVENTRLAIIPNDAKEEVLTYEFKGKIEDRDFLIYVNANTLVIEKIYILLETEGGTLAI